jgi:hypothetical protein
VGIEDIDDLIAELDAALNAVAGTMNRAKSARSTGA